MSSPAMRVKIMRRRLDADRRAIRLRKLRDDVAANWLTAVNNRSSIALGVVSAESFGSPAVANIRQRKFYVSHALACSYNRVSVIGRGKAAPPKVPIPSKAAKTASSGCDRRGGRRNLASLLPPLFFRRMTARPIPCSDQSVLPPGIRPSRTSSSNFVDEIPTYCAAKIRDNPRLVARTTREATAVINPLATYLTLPVADQQFHGQDRKRKLDRSHLQSEAARLPALASRPQVFGSRPRW
jgi:hypothetical protein